MTWDKGDQADKAMQEHWWRNLPPDLRAKVEETMRQSRKSRRGKEDLKKAERIRHLSEALTAFLMTESESHGEAVAILTGTVAMVVGGPVNPRDQERALERFIHGVHLMMPGARKMLDSLHSRLIEEAERRGFTVVENEKEEE